MIVKSQTLKFDETIKLASGKSLSGFELMTETYGELNSEKTNAPISAIVCSSKSNRSR